MTLAGPVVNIGFAADDGTGDPLRTAFAAVNATFAALMSAVDDMEATIADLQLLVGGKTSAADVAAVLYLPLDPGASDIPAGTIRVAKNAATGRLTLWANDGGTMVDLLTFTPAS